MDTWDPANNRIARVEQDGTLVTWSYDATYQLTRERRNGAHSYDTTYAYDPAGNRRLKLDSSVRTSYSYDAANQLQKYVDNTGTTTFTFDASGNQRIQQTPSSGTTTNTWDYENRLMKVALASGILNTFSYNGDGLRVQRQDSLGISKQIWDGQKIIEETDQNNVAQVVYTQSVGLYGDVVSQRRSGAGQYFLFDPLGSTTRLIDGNQNVTDSYLFKASGELLASSGTTINPWRWVGRHGYIFDSDTFSYYLRTRQYSPPIARFLSADIMATFLSADISAMTRGTLYEYARNNLVGNVDPSGLGTFGDVVDALKGALCGISQSNGVNCLCFLLSLIDLIPGLMPWVDAVECIGCGGMATISEACDGDLLGTITQAALAALDCVLSVASAVAWAGFVAATGPVGAGLLVALAIWALVQSLEIAVMFLQQTCGDFAGWKACKAIHNNAKGGF